MTTEIDRKIAVIFIADVVGYSKHMEKDENATIKSFNACEKILNKLLKKYKGSVFNTAGDSVLAEFPSAVNAVECGVAFQNEIKKRNQSDKTRLKLEFRLGINMGDVVKKEENLIGDGVNIAARLEALSQPNGITISKSVYDFVVPKTKMTFNDLGVQKVKQNEFHAFDILIDPSQKRTLKTKSNATMPIIGAFAAVLVLSVASILFFFFSKGSDEVVRQKAVNEVSKERLLGRTLLISPFVNRSGSSDHNYLSEGITDHLISSLSSTILLNVVPRQKSFQIRDEKYTLDQIKDLLNISFVLGGSTYISKEKFRVTFELIELKKNEILWADSKEFDLDDFFNAQDEIEFLTRRALQSNLTMGERYSSILADYFKDSDEYKNVLKLLIEPYKDTFFVTRNYAEPFKLLTERNPNNSFAFLLYAQALLKQQRADVLEFKDYELMHNTILKARDLDPSNSAVYPLLASIEAWAMGMDIMEAQKNNSKGVEMDPNNYLTLALAGSNYDIGDKADSIDYLLQAKEKAPYGPYEIDTKLIRSYLYSHREKEAEALARNLVNEKEEYQIFWGNVYSIYIFARTDRIKEAKDSLKLFLKKNSLEIKDLLNKVRNASFASKGFTDWITYILMLTFDAKSLEKFKKEFPIDIFRFDEDKKIYDQFLSVN